jgi:tetratricopeptide (TPR) repeat protein
VTARPPVPAPRLRLAALAALLALATVAAFLPLAHNGFVNYDDPLYIVDNPRVTGGLSGQGIAWALTSLEGGNWHPLTWISHQLDVELFGMNPGAHHLVGLALHVANAVVLFLVLQGATGAAGRSLVVAGLFALHPLHVESVAWASERKDVLSTFFWMLSVAAYVRHARRPGGGAYALSLGAFALGLAAKPMLVTLPAVLLLLDYWPLGRRGWRRLLVEKAPFLLLAAAAAALALVAQQRGGAITLMESQHHALRAVNALTAYVRYLGKTLWPAGLAIYYPFVVRPALGGAAAVGALALASAGALALGRRWGFVPVGWFWYLATLLPVIGVVQAGTQSMADRYTYVPLVGIFIAAAWGAHALVAGGRGERPAAVGAAVAVAACAVLTRGQVLLWRDSVTLFGHAAAVTERNWLAHENLGVALHARGDVAGAEAQFARALAINPDSGGAHNNLGLIREEQGRLEEARAQFETALRADPGDAPAQNNLGNVLDRMGRPEEALRRYAEALRLMPDFAEAHLNRGVALERLGRVQEAEAAYRRAVALNPRLVKAHLSLGLLLFNRGDADGARASFARALQVDPGSAEAHYYAAAVLESRGRPAEAADHYRAALRLRPAFPEARAGLQRVGGAR